MTSFLISYVLVAYLILGSATLIISNIKSHLFFFFKYLTIKYIFENIFYSF